MKKVKQYGLSHKQYIGVRDDWKISYGGNQSWFPKEDSSLREYLIHEHGCGVIAITDLFLYWAITLPEGKTTFVGKYIDEKGKITKENYMLLVEEVRKKYAFIWGKAGTFAAQLVIAINHYAKEHHIAYKASLDVTLKNLSMLQTIQKMLEADLPVILMIGQSTPILLSRFRKIGIPFYKQKRVIGTFKQNQDKPYAHYEVAKKQIYGHFVTITGIIIDENAEHASQHIMLRISSWGEEYYISYHQLCQYINELSTPYLSTIIPIIAL